MAEQQKNVALSPCQDPLVSPLIFHLLMAQAQDAARLELCARSRFLSIHWGATFPPVIYRSHPERR